MLPIVGKAVDESLVLFLPFEEGGGNTSNDQSGHNNTATLENVKWVNGRHGNAISLDGNDGRISIDDDASLDRMSEITIEMWLYANGLGTPTIVTKGDDWNLGYHSHLWDNGGVYWGFGDPFH